LSIGFCSKLPLAVDLSLQHCTPHVIVHWVHIRRTSRRIVLRDEIWTAGPQPVLCAVYIMLARRPAGRWIRWAAGDCFKRTI